MCFWESRWTMKDGNIHHLFADLDVALADQHTGMMDGLGQAQLEDLCLQAPLQEVLNLQAQDVIQLHFALIQHTNADKATQQSIAFTQTPWVFLVQRQQLPGSLADLSQGEFDPPDLTFVPKPILADQL